MPCGNHDHRLFPGRIPHRTPNLLILRLRVVSVEQENPVSLFGQRVIQELRVLLQLSKNDRRTVLLYTEADILNDRL